MKTNYYIFLMACFLITSCSKVNNEQDSKDLSITTYPQTWNLVKMTGNIPGSVSIGEELEWQEKYVFKSDVTFVKSRISDGEMESASGTYSFNEDTQNFILNYEQTSAIIGNCGSNIQESLYFNEESKILQSNWWACDGPGLFYERGK